ncbi:MAG TPA: LysR family transcriptional regulator [Aggregatilineales bacterium]|nr:LysR family transcriptional regulator [Aggregatilineales bacterium]
MPSIEASLDLHKLRIFVAVARLMNFTRAAEYLHMTQPTVSQQVATLETQLGAALIERDTRRLRLTAAGEALLPYAEKLLALADEAAEVARAAAGVADRTLRLGAGHTLATYVLPELLSRYRTLYPNTIMRISVGNTAELLESVASETTELALVGSPAEHPDIEVTPFKHDRLFVIVSPEDEWAARKSVELEELRSRTILTREPGSALHATVERLLGPSALPADNIIMLGETETIKRSVEAGLGVGLIQGIAIQREIAAGSLCALALHGGDDSRTYSYAMLRRHALSEAATNLVTLLRKQP